MYKSAVALPQLAEVPEKLRRVGVNLICSCLLGAKTELRKLRLVLHLIPHTRGHENCFFLQQQVPAAVHFPHFLIKSGPTTTPNAPEGLLRDHP